MSTPSHYIRTIHTQFTANSSSAAAAHSWATASSRVAAAAAHHSPLLTIGVNQQAPLTQPQYTQVSKYPPGLTPSSTTATSPTSPTHGRRRSSAISSASRARPPAGVVGSGGGYTMKFDPFADEPLVPSSPTLAAAAKAPPPSQTRNRHYHQQHHYQYQQAINHIHNQYQHQQHQQSRLTHMGPATPPAPPRRIPSPPAPAPVSNAPYVVQIPEAFPSSFSSTPSPRPAVQKDREARSKLVAGILLNRVHAVGRPMRRRMPSADMKREYVKSGLSSVVSVEA